jgi:hypothetical protein
MRKPLVVIAGIVAHCLLAAWTLFVSVLSWNKVTWRVITFFVILFGCQIVSIIGLTHRYSWGRRFSMWIFGIYAYLNFSSLNRAMKAEDLWGVPFPILAIAAMAWLIRGLTFSDAKEYFATKS